MNATCPVYATAILGWARFHGDLSQALYQGVGGFQNGSDPVDGECHRLVARAMRELWRGDGIDSVLSRYRNAWEDFASEQNRKVNAAPKIKNGPSSGHSVISYKHASPALGSQGETDILRHHGSAIRESSKYDEI